MRPIILFFISFFCSNVFADSLIKIDMGKDYNKYSQSELQRRVWELERAVSQLQQRVVDLEKNARYDRYDRNDRRPVNWLCKVTAFGKTYTGVSTTKAVAYENALNNCKNSNDDDGFFCKNVNCEQ